MLGAGKEGICQQLACQIAWQTGLTYSPPPLFFKWNFTRLSASVFDLSVMSMPSFDLIREGKGRNVANTCGNSTVKKTGEMEGMDRRHQSKRPWHILACPYHSHPYSGTFIFRPSFA